MNLRGKIFPVADLKRRLGMPPKAKDAKTRIIVAEVHGDQMGLVVDEVREVYRGEPSALEGAPALAQGMTRDYLSGVVSQDERMILLLDLERLMTEEAPA
jgi:purine-binding chemotaxis protein CheW